MFINLTNMKSFFAILLLFSVLSLRSQTVYPKVTGYFGILHPIVNISSETTQFNFSSNYVVGAPTGINLWKNAKIGYSLEMVPFLKSENGNTRMYNVLFHPGVLVKLNPSLTFAGRLAFETTGRFGFTPIFTKTVIKKKDHSFYLSVPFPFRFGNNVLPTVGTGLQVGIAF